MGGLVEGFGLLLSHPCPLSPETCPLEPQSRMSSCARLPCFSAVSATMFEGWSPPPLIVSDRQPEAADAEQGKVVRFGCTGHPDNVMQIATKRGGDASARVGDRRLRARAEPMRARWVRAMLRMRFEPRFACGRAEGRDSPWSLQPPSDP